ncbi:MAG TPA: PKD domain-containing protein, partial [Longimicrobium sp.]|nr:PKD domain-containing protein [Longimicrobium sp.]
GVSNSTATDRLTVVVNHPPVAVARTSRARAAAGEVVHFDASASSDADGRLRAYRWDFGNGASAEGVKVAYAYDTPGTYTVTLTVTDDSGTSSHQASAKTTVVVNQAPRANANGDKLVTTSEVRFDGTGSRDEDGAIAGYLWDFGDGHVSDEPSPTHVFAQPGQYRVRLWVTDDSSTANGRTAHETVVVVNERPIANAGPDRRAAAGDVLAFSGARSVDPDGEVVEYQWDFGDGGTAGGEAVRHTYAAPGRYTVRLTVRDNSGQPQALDTDESVVVVNAPPRVRLGPDLLVAPGQPVTLDGRGASDPDGKIVSWRWELSDGSPPATTPTLTRTFARPGIVYASLTVTDDSGTRSAQARDSVRIHVNGSPRARPGDSRVTCERTLSFDGTASADPDGHPLSYAWDFGDKSAPASGARVTHTFQGGGTFPIVLKVDDGTRLPNSHDSAATTLTIAQPPIADAGGDRNACAGETVIFNAGKSRDPEQGLLKYRWEFGDGSGAEGQSPTKVYQRGGIYQVLLTAQDDSGLACDTGTDRVVVRVAESPVAEAGPDQVVCSNREVRFDGGRSRDFDGLVNSFAWDFGDSQKGGGATPTHVYTQAGTYRVSLVITGDRAGECDNTDTDELLVTVHDAPVARFKAPAMVALGEEALFDASESASTGPRIVSRSWDFGDGTSAEGEQVKHVFQKPGRYLVTLAV